MKQGLGLLELVRDRLNKRGLYDSPAYWDKKATRYRGLARSNWPSNAYNEHVHRQQMAAIDEALGEVQGLTIADVGCGTGRTSIHLAARGATVTGLDFSPKSLEAARREATAAEAPVTFAEYDVLGPPDETLGGRFDVVLTVGCLTLACKNEGNLARALGNLAGMLRPGGRALFLEPIHSSALLSRILRLSVADWIRMCEARGLRLVARRGLLFVPSRYALAFHDLPAVVNDPVFAVGERILDLSSQLEWLGDYKILLFQAPA
jgi:2-polyprenyl-3-methyl-5-hydroxy-6-metoxy-1,4-benzoquinol methylase